jgi:hypothetical protein
MQQVKAIQLPVEPASGWAWHAEPLKQSASEAALWAMRQAEVVQVLTSIASMPASFRNVCLS